MASADVDLGDQDDRLTVSSALSTTAHGGTGKDSVPTGSGNDTLNGGDSADTLFGAAGNDTMSGDAGNDTLDGGGGGDTFNGDAGLDKASYSTRPARSPVQVDIDGVNDDGGTVDGNADNVTATIEVVIAGAGDDSLTGSAAADTLTGGAGADTIDGGAGDDMLDGGTGADDIAGGANSDTVTYATRLAGQGVQVDIDDVADDGGTLDANADNIRRPWRRSPAAPATTR